MSISLNFCSHPTNYLFRTHLVLMLQEESVDLGHPEPVEVPLPVGEHSAHVHALPQGDVQGPLPVVQDDVHHDGPEVKTRLQELVLGGCRVARQKGHLCLLCVSDGNGLKNTIRRSVISKL